jgi:general secretion pathway protein G
MNMSCSRRRRRGFTLMEVLLVLAILVILASLVGVSYVRLQQNANINSARTQIGMLEEACNHYTLSVGVPPNTLEDLLTLPADLPNPTKWAGPYLEKSTLPVDPWNNPYQYEIVDPATSKFRIYSLGPDRTPGSADDISSAL